MKNSWSNYDSVNVDSWKTRVRKRISSRINKINIEVLVRQ